MIVCGAPAKRSCRPLAGPLTFSSGQRHFGRGPADLTQAGRVRKRPVIVHTEWRRHGQAGGGLESNVLPLTSVMRTFTPAPVAWASAGGGSVTMALAPTPASSP